MIIHPLRNLLVKQDKHFGNYNKDGNSLEFKYPYAIKNGKLLYFMNHFRRIQNGTENILNACGTGN